MLLLGASVVAFGLIHLTPGDPAAIMLGQDATPRQIVEVRAALGLDRPLPEQYLRYLARLSHGDFGESIRARRPVMSYILERLPYTVQLATTAFVLALLVGIPLGMVAAVHRDSWVDHLARGVALVAQSVPGMWLGLLLITVFAVAFHLLPSIGAGTPRQLILPSITLASYLIGLVVRLVRSAMLEILYQDYVRTARAKGLPELPVLVRHVLRNALVPVVAIMGLQFGTLLSGAVVTESVFAWPGLGTLLLQAISQRDYPVIQAAVLLSAGSFVLLNLLVDFINHWIDPRTRISAANVGR